MQFCSCRFGFLRQTKTLNYLLKTKVFQSLFPPISEQLPTADLTVPKGQRDLRNSPFFPYYKNACQLKHLFHWGLIMTFFLNKISPSRRSRFGWFKWMQLVNVFLTTPLCLQNMFLHWQAIKKLCIWSKYILYNRWKWSLINISLNIQLFWMSAAQRFHILYCDQSQDIHQIWAIEMNSNANW